MLKPARFGSIEALRGVAALAVVLFHFNGQIRLPIVGGALAYGWLGVDVFFVISGFVIPYSLWKRSHTIQQFPAYMARRLVRVEPPYLLSIVLIVVLTEMSVRFGATPASYSAAQIAYHLFYAIPLTHEKWLNVVYWSLAYEFVFYMVVGLTFSQLVGRHVAYTLALVATVVAVRYLIIREWDEMAPLVLLFVPGILTMRYLANIDSRRAFLVCVGPCCILIEWLRPGAGLAAAATVAIIILLRDRTPPRWMLFLGGTSYSLYLVHTVIGGRVINLGRRFDTPELLLFAGALVITLAFAALFAWLIERPSTKASHGIGLRRGLGYNPRPNDGANK